jgi:predicted RNA-binding protein with PIN domain
MPVLIDGNNLLFAARDTDPERPPSRSTLCLKLGQWARRTGENVAVIFDGPAPAGPLARQIDDPDVAVGYSGAGVSADDVLIRTIEADSAARLLLVVSSDREIARVARRRRARAMRSDEFWALLQGDLARPQRSPLEPDEKRRGLRAADTESWLRELGLHGGEPDAGEEGQ